MASTEQRKVDDIVHRARGAYVAGRKDLQVCCNTLIGNGWFQPKWGDGNDKTADPDVFVANNDHLYTFITEKTTCKACRDLF